MMWWIAAFALAGEGSVYNWVPAESTAWVIVRSDPDAWLSGLGHDHVIAASSFSGQLELMESAPFCKASIEIPVSALVPDPPGSREAVGMDSKRLGSSNETKMLERMKADDQLNASVYPTITLTVSSCSAASGKVKAKGDFKAIGVDAPLSIDAQITAADGAVSVKGEFTLQHSDLGISPVRAMGGGIRNLPTLAFRFDLKATPKP